METRTDLLATAAAAFLAANLVHGADHLRQGLAGVGEPVKVGGALLTAAAVTVAWLAVRARAAAAPAAVGLTAAALITSAHVLPHWSALSNSYVDDVRVDALSWAVVLLEIAAALVLGAAGAARLRGTVRHG